MDGIEPGLEQPFLMNQFPLATGFGAPVMLTQ